MKRLRFTHERLVTEAKRLREKAKLLPPGVDREALLRKARLDEMVAHIDKWLNSRGLRPPT
ncbi:hypothetical protein NLN62_04200 [Bradyrhizobium sp. CCGUVB23]|nr:hypothetical protein [Bradyrhizobium sp. CCGUVB23]MCP3459587.1 hypothetical protein [Bradyrhizobium sp. CCGUVB23]